MISQRLIPALYLILLLAGFLSMIDAQSSRTQSLTGFKKEYTPDLDLSSAMSQATWRTSETNLQNCALICTGQVNCTAFSLTDNTQTGETSCKTGTVSLNGTVTNAGSQLYYKLTVDKDSFSTHLDPFRYKLIESPVTSAGDATEICESIGALLPVAYPSQKAFSTVRSFMPQNGAIFLGMTLTGIDNATGIQSFVTYRGWNFKANASDPMQHWLPGEPKLHQDYVDDLSDIEVMMTPEGWFTANTRKGDVLTSNVVCIRHSVYHLVSSIKKYYKDKGATTANRGTTERICQSEEAHPATFLGSEGLALFDYFESKSVTDYWMDGLKSNVTAGHWEFSDGTVMDASVVAKRWDDPRQIWRDASYPRSFGNYRCLTELDKGVKDEDCNIAKKILCEGDF